MSRKAVQLIILFFAAVASIRAFDEAQTIKASQKSPDNCLTCHQKNNDETSKLFLNSTHARRSISCGDCHGGDRTATDKQAAHAQNFIGKPRANQILEICGSCHKSQLAVFKASRHFPENRQEARVDCVQCHGAHTIGKYVGNADFSITCTNCHGLEYLPELPSPLQKILTMNDEIRDALRDLQSAGRQPTEEILRQRREFRRQIAEIVHATDAKSAIEKAPTILLSGDGLKKLIAQARGNR